MTGRDSNEQESLDATQAEVHRWRFIITVGGTVTSSLLALGLATLPLLIRRKYVYIVRLLLLIVAT